MIKLRVQGKPDEIIKFIDEIKKGNFDILEESMPYKNRGKSSYVRTYIDIEMKEEK